jgi:hypothetical protein
MTWTVIVVEPCLSWLHELRRSDRGTLIQVSRAITTLAEEGPGLGRPLVDTISGSSLPNLKELRPGSSGGTEVRLQSSSTRNVVRFSWSAAIRPENGQIGIRGLFRTPSKPTRNT